jgi:hypothetical protein
VRSAPAPTEALLSLPPAVPPGWGVLSVVDPITREDPKDLFIGGSDEAAAATPPSPPASSGPNPWRFSLALYLWLTEMHGDATVRGISSDVDVEFSDTLDALDELQFGIMGHTEVHHGRFGLLIDGMYLSFESRESTPLGEATVEFDQAIVEAAAAYEFLRLPLGEEGYPTLLFEALAGARWVYLDAHFQGPLGLIDRNETRSWVDPIVGGRAGLEAFRWLTLWVQADAGGFDLGSDFSWHVLGGAKFHLTRHLFLIAGYKVLAIDYHRRSGNDRFEYDVRTDGPVAAIGVEF